MHFNENLSFQITHDPSEKEFSNNFRTISRDIAAVNLHCINYEDPSNSKCTDGWLFRQANAEDQEFLKYSAMQFTCLGKNFLRL